MRFVEEARKRQGEKDNQMSRSEGAMQRWGEAQGASVTSVMKAIWLSALKITEQDTVISSNNSTYFTWFKRMPNCDTMTTHVGENKNTTQTTIGEFMSIHRNTHRGGGVTTDGSEERVRKADVTHLTFGPVCTVYVSWADKAADVLAAHMIYTQRNWIFSIPPWGRNRSKPHFRWNRYARNQLPTASHPSTVTKVWFLTLLFHWHQHILETASKQTLDLFLCVAGSACQASGGLKCWLTGAWVWSLKMMCRPPIQHL